MDTLAKCFNRFSRFECRFMNELAGAMTNRPGKITRAMTDIARHRSRSVANGSTRFFKVGTRR